MTPKLWNPNVVAEIGSYDHVGAFWDPREIRELNQLRRRTNDVIKRHAKIERDVAKLRKMEEDLEDLGVDLAKLYRNYDLMNWPARGDND